MNLEADSPEFRLGAMPALREIFYKASLQIVIDTEQEISELARIAEQFKADGNYDLWDRVDLMIYEYKEQLKIERRA